MALARESPLTLEELSATPSGSELASKVQSLLEKTNTTRVDWVKDGPLYAQCRRDAALKRLHRIQASIIRVVTERTLELDVLHHRIRGHKQAKKVISAINTRWRQLDRLVTDYNKEVTRINAGGQELEIGSIELRKISARDIRERGIDCDEVWDVDRMSSRSDWARYHFVRDGIEAAFLLERVAEERSRLQLHLKRTSRWLLRQCGVLLQILDPVANVSNHTIPHEAVAQLLLWRERVATNLLEIKHADLLSADAREQLQGECFELKRWARAYTQISGLRLRIAKTLRQNHVSRSQGEPTEPTEPTEGGLEGDGDDAGGVDGDPGEVDDGLFALQGDDFDEELAERIMLQDQFVGTEDELFGGGGDDDAAVAMADE